MMNPQRLARAAADEPVGIWLAFAAVAMALLPNPAATMTALVTIAIAVALTALLRPMSHGLANDRFVLAALVAPALALTVSSVLASNPGVSFFGSTGQRAGAATWVLCAAFAAALLRTARRGDAGRTARAAACFAAVLALAAIADRFAVFGPIPAGSLPAGLLENTLSTGQVLVMGVLCAGAWGFSAPTRLQRAVSIACGAMCVVSIAYIGSLGTWAGLAVGVVTVAIVHAVSRAGRLRALSAGIGAAVAGLVAPAGMLLITGPAMPEGLQERLAAAASDRFPIWQSAASSAWRSPVFGVGPEQFTGFTTWGAVPPQSLSFTSTFDPHNLLLYLLVCGGVVGLGSALFACAVLARRALLPLEGRPSLPRACMVGALAGYLVSLLFSWVTPISLALAAAIVAALVAGRADGSPQSRPGAWLMRVPVAAVALAIAAGLFATGGIWEYRWGADLAEYGNPRIETTLAAAQDSPDPLYSIVTVQNSMNTSFAEGEPTPYDDPRFAVVVERLKTDADWHCTAAMTSFDLAVRDIRLGTANSWDAAGAALAAGEMADPRTGLWYYTGTAYAENLGFAAEARQYAQDGLAYDLPENVRAYMVERAYLDE
ncbi:MAG: O-antigen ligase domain-containing protein [Actinobacteria bacterium]|nr:O-antigen ligase domain-containing protein [Actinomycetota bacterium]